MLLSILFANRPSVTLSLITGAHPSVQFRDAEWCVLRYDRDFVNLEKNTRYEHDPKYAKSFNGQRAFGTSAPCGADNA